MTTEVRAYVVDLEDDDGEIYQQFLWDCPQCGNTNECPDNFIKKNNRYEYRHLHWCEFCDEDEVLLYKK